MEEKKYNIVPASAIKYIGEALKEGGYKHIIKWRNNGVDIHMYDTLPNEGSSESPSEKDPNNKSVLLIFKPCNNPNQKDLTYFAFCIHFFEERPALEQVVQQAIEAARLNAPKTI